MLSGGVEKLRFLLSGSAEKSGQYKDGNGDDFYGQIANAITAGQAVAGNQFQTKYKDMDAYTKKTLMGKVYYDITDNQELRASFTMNNSDNVLYPNSPMDAIYDDSKIYTLGYTAKNLGSLSKKLDLELYRSTVDHPMATKYRNAGATNYVTAHLDTEMEGAKLTNSFELGNHTITAGVDMSNRNWDGVKYSTAVATGIKGATSLMIDDVDTKNRAIFLKDKIALNDKLTLEAGARYDDTTIDKHGVKQRDLSDFSGYLFSKYALSDSLDIFGGLGHSVRVPDAKELYLVGSGTPTLNAVANNEIDLGIEKKFDKFNIKAKTFYSQLDNYIAYSATSLHYENVDAVVYGMDISGVYALSENLSIDAGASYQVGKKDKPLAGQIETNMPDIAPLRGRIGLDYEVQDNYKLELDMFASAPWENFDAANGEQKLDSYIALNLKGTKVLGDGLEITAGVDNIFDNTYALSNTYKDLTLLAGGGSVMLLNEPGRYFYTQLKYRF
jgi:iron complex outermembrane receptor protein